MVKYCLVAIKNIKFLVKNGAQNIIYKLFIESSNEGPKCTTVQQTAQADVKCIQTKLLIKVYTAIMCFNGMYMCSTSIGDVVAVVTDQY